MPVAVGGVFAPRLVRVAVEAERTWAPLVTSLVAHLRFAPAGIDRRSVHRRNATVQRLVEIVSSAGLVRPGSVGAGL